jgi:GTPase SAR1 family protein
LFGTFLLGTAGSGKSTLVSVLQQWLASNELDVATFNLDPGVRTLPYGPDIDIRDYISLDAVMNEYGLGPNGGLLVSVDLIANELDALQEELEDLAPEVVLFDTPGQIELFAYRTVGPLVFSSLGGEKNVITYLYDAYLTRDPAGFISLAFLGTSINFRFQLPMVSVLAKADLLSSSELERILDWAENPASVAIDLESSAEGASREMSILLFDLLAQFTGLPELHPVSFLEFQGVAELYALLTRYWSAGEDFVTQI